MSPNERPAFSDVEVLTICLWGGLRGHAEVRALDTYTRDHLAAWFPRLPAYATYVQRLNRLSEVFVPLMGCLQQDLPQREGEDLIRLIDAMPIMLAKAQRSDCAKVAPALANTGYNATKKTSYYGVELHILAFGRPGHLPLPDSLGLTPASEADLTVLKAIAEDIHGTPVYADKASMDAALSELLRQQQAPLTTPVTKKKGPLELRLFQAAFSTLVSQVRQPIESLFHWLHEKTGIPLASKVRSSQGLLVHVFGKIAAALLLLRPNF